MLSCVLVFKSKVVRVDIEMHQNSLEYVQHWLVKLFLKLWNIGNPSAALLLIAAFLRKEFMSLVNATFLTNNLLGIVARNFCQNDGAFIVYLFITCFWIL